MWTHRRSSGPCAKFTQFLLWTPLKNSTLKRKPSNNSSLSRRNSIKTAAKRSFLATRYRQKATPNHWELTLRIECINRWTCRIWVQGWKAPRKCTARTTKITIFTTIKATISTTVVTYTMRVTYTMQVTARANFGQAKRSNCHKVTVRTQASQWRSRNQAAAHYELRGTVAAQTRARINNSRKTHQT